LKGVKIGDRYVIDDVVGRGGSGVVYGARDERTGARVAIKVVRRSTEAVDRFEREVLASSRLDSPYLCEILKSGVLPTGESFLVMPLLRGMTLRELMARAAPLPLALALSIEDQVLAALEAAHGVGVVHRDLKPANVFLLAAAGPDFVKVLDFEIARLVGGADGAHTATGRAVGTAQYMAPEQARGQRDQDLRVDLWAAGVLLYEMLTGARPFDGGSWAQTLECVLFDPYVLPRVRRPELPEVVEIAVVRALQRERDARFADAGAMRQLLRTALGHESQPSSPVQAVTLSDEAPAHATDPDTDPTDSAITREVPTDEGTPPASDD
jgi:serine/threonine-protein kinase